MDDYYKELVLVRGEECARLYYQSVMAAISRAEAIQDLENIDVGQDTARQLAAMA